MKQIKDEYYPEGFDKRSGFDDLTPWSTRIEPFNAGQPYEKKPAKPIECRVCKSTTFEVAIGDHWTGIRCVFCKYEICVHSG